MTIRVLLVDDQAVVRMGLGMMIDAEPDMEVVGEAADGLQAIEAAARLRPDVVLMDVRMPGLDGISATRRIMDAGTADAVVIVTTFDDEEYLLDGVRAGAFGFLLKDAGPDLIAAGIRTARAGDTLIAPAMTKSLLEARLRGDVGAGSGSATTDAVTAVPAATRELLDALSPRERDVLAAVARGASNADIAKDLWVSEATVKTHISNVLTKTATTSRVQAAVFAYESGFVRPGWLAPEPRE
jgi:DNA-binding NarL/FixJ family response regulator